MSKRNDEDMPFSAAHLLASAHSTSLSSSRSDLLPTSTTTKWGLANVLASASHLERFVKDSRLKDTNEKFEEHPGVSCILCDIIHKNGSRCSAVITPRYRTEENQRLNKVDNKRLSQTETVLVLQYPTTW